VNALQSFTNGVTISYIKTTLLYKALHLEIQLRILKLIFQTSQFLSPIHKAKVGINRPRHTFERIAIITFFSFHVVMVGFLGVSDFVISKSKYLLPTYGTIFNFLIGEYPQ
jgi:hypothetical protein